MKKCGSYPRRARDEKVRQLKDERAEADQLIDWEKLRIIVSGMYRNDTERGGRSNLNEVMIVNLCQAVVPLFTGVANCHP